MLPLTLTPSLATLGCLFLITGGLVLIVLNGRRLIIDWPRQRPRHNVDIAFIQFYLGFVMVGLGVFVGRGVDVEAVREDLRTTPTFNPP